MKSLATSFIWIHPCRPGSRHAQVSLFNRKHSVCVHKCPPFPHSNHSQKNSPTWRWHCRQRWLGIRSLVWKLQLEIMETNLHAHSTQHKSSYLPPSPQIPTHRVLAIPFQPRTSPLRIHRTLTTNHQYHQIHMSDMGRPLMDRHQRTYEEKVSGELGSLTLSSSGKAVKTQWRTTLLQNRRKAGKWGISLSGEFESHSYRWQVCSFFAFLSYPCLR